MDWFILVLLIGLSFINFCIGYIFGLIKNKELDKKYFVEYKKDMQFLSGYQPKYDLDTTIPPKSCSNAILKIIEKGEYNKTKEKEQNN